MYRIKSLLLASLMSLSPLLAHSEDQASVDAVLHGQGLAETNCSQCHAVGLSGKSPNTSAPPFRTFSSYRSVTLIGWELMNKDWGEHRKMPQFQITAEQTRDILEWIRWVQPVARGKRIVDANCSQCHAVELDDKSDHPAAVPFRDLSRFFPVSSLEEALAEGITTGHPDMPEYTATPDQIVAIIAYMESIQEKPRQ